MPLTGTSPSTQVLPPIQPPILRRWLSVINEGRTRRGEPSLVGTPGAPLYGDRLYFQNGQVSNQEGGAPLYYDPQTRSLTDRNTGVPAVHGTRYFGVRVANPNTVAIQTRTIRGPVQVPDDSELARRPGEDIISFRDRIQNAARFYEAEKEGKAFGIMESEGGLQQIRPIETPEERNVAEQVANATDRFNRIGRLPPLGTVLTSRQPPRFPLDERNGLLADEAISERLQVQQGGPGYDIIHIPSPDGVTNIPLVYDPTRFGNEVNASWVERTLLRVSTFGRNVGLTEEPFRLGPIGIEPLWNLFLGSLSFLAGTAWNGLVSQLVRKPTAQIARDTERNWQIYSSLVRGVFDGSMARRNFQSMGLTEEQVDDLELGFFETPRARQESWDRMQSDLAAASDAALTQLPQVEARFLDRMDVVNAAREAGDDPAFNTAYNDAFAVAQEYVRLYRQSRPAALGLDVTRSWSWSMYPEREQQFMDALAHSMVQLGYPPDYWQVQQIKERYQDAAMEFAGGIIFDTLNIPIVSGIGNVVVDTTKFLARGLGQVLGQAIDKIPMANRVATWAARMSVRGASAKISNSAWRLFDAVANEGTRAVAGPVGEATEAASKQVAEAIWLRMSDVAKRLRAAAENPDVTVLSRTVEEMIQAGELPARAGPRVIQDLIELSRVVDPDDWGKMYTDATSALIQEMRQWPRYRGLYRELLSKLRATMDDVGQATTEALNAVNARIVDDINANPRILGGEIRERFRRIYTRSQMIGASQIANDQVLGKIVGRLDPASGKYVFRSKFLAWVSQAWVRIAQVYRGLTTWTLLALRPAWVAWNYVDSTYRLALFGKAAFNDLVDVARGVTRLADDKILPAELATQMLRSGRGVGRGIIEQVISGDWKPKFGPLSFLWENTRRFTKQVEQEGLRARDVFAPVKLTGESLLDYTAAMEFGLRYRLSHQYFARTLDMLDEPALAAVIAKVIPDAERGLRDIMAYLWRRYRTDPDGLRQAVNRIVRLSGRGKAQVSLLIPTSKKFQSILQRLDPSEQDTVIREVTEWLEENLAATLQRGRGLTGSQVDDFFNTLQKQVDDDIIRRTGPNSGADSVLELKSDDITAPPKAEAPVEAVPEPKPVPEEVVPTQAPETIKPKPKKWTPEELDVPDDVVTREPMVVELAPQSYLDAGRLQREAMGKVGNRIRQAVEAQGELAGEELTRVQSVVSQAQRWMDDVGTLRDRINQWFLNAVPGPLRRPLGTDRARAWERFFAWKEVQVYNQLTRWTDEIVSAIDSGAEVKILSADEFLRRLGIELDYYPSGAIRTVRFRLPGNKKITILSETEQLTGIGSWRIRELRRYFGLSNKEEWTRAWSATGAPPPSATIDTTVANVADQAERLTQVQKGAVVTDPDLQEAWETYVKEVDPRWSQLFGDNAKTYEGLLQYLSQNIARMGERISVSLTPSQLKNLRLYFDAWREARVGREAAENIFRDFAKKLGLTQEQAIKVLRGEVVEVTSDLTNTYAYRSMLSMSYQLERLRSSILAAVDGTRLVTPIPFPTYKLSEELLTFVGAMFENAAKYTTMKELLEEWQAVLKASVADGTWFVKPLSREWKKALLAWSNDAARVKQEIIDVALYGTKDEAVLRHASETTKDIIQRVGPDAEGAVPKANRIMVNYDEEANLDFTIKGFIPFWMFPSRTIPVWLEALALHPELVAFYNKYLRYSRTKAYEMGAVNSRGDQLPRLEGYIPIPGTEMWFNPTAPFSIRMPLRWIFHPARRYTERNQEEGILQTIVRELFEYGPLYGFTPYSIWTIVAYESGWLDPNRVPPWGVLAQTDLLPPWWQDDIRSLLRKVPIAGHYTDYILPEVSWKDYLIERDILAWGLAEIEKNPAMAEVIGERVKQAIRQREGNALWEQQKRTTEETEYFASLGAYFVGLFPKPFTDAEAELLKLRDQLNEYRDSFNLEIGYEMFNLDPDVMQRYEVYKDLRYNTTEGDIYNLYGSIRFTNTPEGKPTYGEERRQLILDRIHEDEVTEAYFEAIKDAVETRDVKLAELPIGAGSDTRAQIYEDYFATRQEIEQSQLYEVARRSFIVGYQPYAVLEDRFVNQWWQFLRETTPRWMKEQGQSYEEWQMSVGQWLIELPSIAKSLASTFEYEAFADYFAGLEKRGFDVSKFVQQMLRDTNAENYELWRKQNATIYGALNDAWTALYWDPYWQAMQELSGKERQLAEAEFLRQHTPPTPEELARWVGENYPPGLFPYEELVQRAGAQGITSVEERLAPTDPASKLRQEFWDILQAVPPGQAYGDFLDAFRDAGGDPAFLDGPTGWWETGGDNAGLLSETDFRIQVEAARRAAEALQLSPPTPEELREQVAAQDLNDQYKELVAARFGEDFLDTRARYYSMSFADQAEWRKANPELYKLIRAYPAFRDEFGRANPLWAKYYRREVLEGGGVSGVGGGVGGAGRGGGGAGSGARNRLPDMLLPGLRSTWNASDLLDASRLGRGGITRAPRWPDRLTQKVGPMATAELNALRDKGKTLSDPAKKLLKTVAQRDETLAPYVEEILAADYRLGGGGPKMMI